MKAAIAVLALGLFTGCASTSASPQGIDGPVKLGQVAFVDGPRVRPDQVIEDSRCPIDVVCVWAGRVVLRATVFGGSWSKTVDLTLGTPVPVADGMLTLVAVEPARRRNDRTGPQHLRFTFAFEGGL